MNLLPRLLPALLFTGLMLLEARGAEGALEVRIQQGVVEGKREGSIRAFLGVPYAAPPVGELRWRPPVPAASWNGVRPAKEFGPRPMQLPIYKDMVFRDSGPSEDSLTVNIWTPPAATGAKLPVMFWVFGGGLQAGGTSEPRQDGGHLAARGVVVVSVNYRLGIFGFLTHPDLAVESPKHATGNYGFLDQVAALRWVHDNIAAFGGDPDNVTIFGESAGSYSVSALMASPLAQGLFHRAIGQSGAFGFTPPRPSAAPLEARARRNAERLYEVTGTHTLAELRAFAPIALLEVLKAKGADLRFGAEVDGWFLPRMPLEIFSQQKHNDVPLIAGWVRDERAVALSANPPPMDALRTTALKDFGAEADVFLRLYPGDTPERAARSGAEYANDRFIAFGTWSWLEAQRRYGHSPVYRYRLDRAPPADVFGKTGRGVYHSADILYVFGTFEAQPLVPWTTADRQASDRMQAYWVNFAKTGNPNGPGLTSWPRYAEGSEYALLRLDAQPESEPDHFRARYEFLAAKDTAAARAK
jgi:para-nitrobenzyl esterase